MTDRRGERNGRALLTERQVNEMRQLWADGIGPTALAERYGVACVTVEKIVYGCTWKHLPLPEKHG